MNTRSGMLLAALAITGTATFIISASTAGEQPSRRSRNNAHSHTSPTTQLNTQHASDGAVAGGGIGPDVIVGSLHNLAHFTPNNTGGAVDGFRAYAVGTTSCNIGTENLSWIAETNQHPVIGQSLYRLKNGRFEHIGQSWLKHGFFALWESTCDTCTGDFFTCQGNCLIVGCSDPYDAGLNGDNSGAGLGPKSEVNPATGVFNYPHGISNCGTAKLCQRLQVRESDLEPHTTGTTAIYYAEGQYITPDDAAAGNGNNNASHRRLWVNSNYNLTFTNPLGGTNGTVRELPAIYAWQANDPAVQIETIDIPGDGRIIVAWKVTDLGGGLWEYEYAVHNLNSHRAINSFSLPVSQGVDVTSIGFHDVDYHSGEPYDGTDWPGMHISDNLAWATDDYTTNPNANAIRWGTLYNFRFVADSPPTSGPVTLGVFRPVQVAGDPANVSITASIPTFITPCLADTVTNATIQPPPDGVVDGADLASLLSWWGPYPESPSDIVNGDTIQPPPDGVVDGADLAYLLGEWGPCE